MLCATCFQAICLNAIWGRSSSTKGDAGVDRGIGAAASFHRGMQRYVLQCFKCYMLENVVFYMLENVICFKCYILCASMLQFYMLENLICYVLQCFNAISCILFNACSTEDCNPSIPSFIYIYLSSSSGSFVLLCL